MPTGTLEVSILDARNLKNKDGIFGGGNDAYVLIKTPHQKFKTEVKKNAGKEATWNQTFRLGVTDKVEQLKLELWDSDKIADDLIGGTTIPLGSVFQSGHANQYYIVGKGGKEHGEIQLVIKFIPGSFPQGFDPNSSVDFDTLKTAGGIAGGLLAAGALAYGAKVAYDHYSDKNKKDEQHAPLHQGGGNQPPHGNASNQGGYGSGGYNQQQGSGYGQQGGYQQHGNQGSFH